MTNEAIEALIDDINAGSAADRIFLRPLVGRIWTAAVWVCEPRGRASNEGAHRFYFVFSDDGFCVAAIENLGGDLHALTKPEYRHRRIMEDTLRHVVLPHIFSSGVMNQTVQIINGILRTSAALIRVRVSYTCGSPRPARRRVGMRPPDK